jgi:branched-subunit amino acid transport protein
MIPDPGTVWLVIALMAVGTFLLRFSFLGLIGDRPLPGWLLRLLRYTPMAVIPGLMAPQIFLPPAGASGPNWLLIAAIAVTLAVGIATRHVVLALLAGAGTLTALMLAAAYWV